MSNFKKISLALIFTLALSGCFLNKSKPETGNGAADGQGDGANINTIQNPEGDNPNISITEDSGQQPASENPVAVLKTSKGDIKLELFAKDAPRTVENFLKLAKADFYDGVAWHRVIPNFMIQGGDPLSKDGNPLNDGTGGPGYLFEDEINQHKIVRGTLAMANAGPNSNGSQFFILTTAEAAWLDGKHTVFGRVLAGMDAADAISQAARDENDRPLQNIVISDVIIEKQ